MFYQLIRLNWVQLTESKRNLLKESFRSGYRLDIGGLVDDGCFRHDEYGIDLIKIYNEKKKMRIARI